jgi:AcrR family transcriptional regulator
MPVSVASDTKSRLLRAAITAFGQHGFAGASVRQIGRLAKTNAAGIMYHYDSKEALWRAVVKYLQRELLAHIFLDQAKWPGMTPRERVKNTTRRYIEFCARYPELQRIIMFETIHGGERLDWLVENHLARFTDGSIAWVQLAQDEGVFPETVSSLHLHLILTGAAHTIFMTAPHIERSLGIDVFSEEETEKHIEAVMQLIFRRDENAPDDRRSMDYPAGIQRP